MGVFASRSALAQQSGSHSQFLATQVCRGCPPSGGGRVWGMDRLCHLWQAFVSGSLSTMGHVSAEWSPGPGVCGDL